MMSKENGKYMTKFEPKLQKKGNSNGGRVVKIKFGH